MKTGLPTAEKLRLAIVRAFHEQGLTYEEIADLLDVGTATVNRILRLHRQTGTVAPRPRGGGRISPIRGKVASELKRLVAERPDSTVAELMERLISRTGVQTSLAGVKRALHRLGFTHKKRSSSPSSATRRRTSGGAASSPRS